MANAKKFNYSEPTDYIPESLRKQYGLGEYAEEKDTIRENLKKENEKSVNDLIKKRK